MGTVRLFLFTDIQDSTCLSDESPADMAAAVQVHDAILRNAIDRHDGYVFARGGDGIRRGVRHAGRRRHGPVR